MDGVTHTLRLSIMSTFNFLKLEILFSSILNHLTFDVAEVSTSVMNCLIYIMMYWDLIMKSTYFNLAFLGLQDRDLLFILILVSSFTKITHDLDRNINGTMLISLSIANAISVIAIALSPNVYDAYVLLVPIPSIDRHSTTHDILSLIDWFCSFALVLGLAAWYLSPSWMILEGNPRSGSAPSRALVITPPTAVLFFIIYVILSLVPWTIFIIGRYYYYVLRAKLYREILWEEVLNTKGAKTGGSMKVRARRRRGRNLSREAVGKDELPKKILVVRISSPSQKEQVRKWCRELNILPDLNDEE